ncbi:MAG: hypothetical protein ACPLX8_00255 [Nanopusillaceae archaeon]
MVAMLNNEDLDRLLKKIKVFVTFNIDKTYFEKIKGSLKSLETDVVEISDNSIEISLSNLPKLTDILYKLGLGPYRIFFSEDKGTDNFLCRLVNLPECKFKIENGDLYWVNKLEKSDESKAKYLFDGYIISDEFRGYIKTSRDQYKIFDSHLCKKEHINYKMCIRMLQLNPIYLGEGTSARLNIDHDNIVLLRRNLLYLTTRTNNEKFAVMVKYKDHYLSDNTLDIDRYSPVLPFIITSVEYEKMDNGTIKLKRIEAQDIVEGKIYYIDPRIISDSPVLDTFSFIYRNLIIDVIRNRYI